VAEHGFTAQPEPERDGLLFLPRLYLQLIAARARSQVQYRGSFALQLIGTLLLSFGDFLAIWVIFTHLPRLDGWSLGEVALLYGMSSVSFALTDMFVGHLDDLADWILRGEFDAILTRPLPAFFTVLTAEFALHRLGRIAQGVAALLIALALIDVHWTLARALLLIVAIPSGAVIFGAVWVAGVTTAFWSQRSTELVNAFTYGGQQLTSYPMSIYSGSLRGLFTFAIPLAFVDYYPALYILGKSDPLHLPYAARFAAPLVAVALLLIVRPIWGLGVRHYRSTGS
jgi:ABC-2 type transport system permease protein